MNLFTQFERVALQRPDHPAIVTPDLTLGFGKLLAAVGALAGALHDRGVREGDVVAMQVRAQVPHVQLSLALARIGAVSLPLPGERGDDVRGDIVSLCKPKFFVHSEAVVAELVRSQCTAPPVAAVGPDTVWRIVHSSGTTGRPKPIPCTHTAQLLKCALYASFMPSTPDERVFVAMGPAIMFAINYWMRPLLSGSTLAVGPTLANAGAGAVLDAIHTLRATHLVTSPGNALTLLAAARKRGGAFLEPAASMRVLVLGGSAVAPAQQALFKKHIAPELFISYGMTEVGLVALSDAATQADDPSCAGAIPPWLEVQAVGEDGAPLPPGSAGRLRMRGATMATGYWSEAGEDAAAFRDGWFHSRDVGRVTPGGRIYVEGREGDVINLAGAKIDPLRVEAVIASEPGVHDCAVFVRESGMGLPRLAAAVVLSPGSTTRVAAGALRDRCRRELGIAATPVDFFEVASLPRNSAGKLMRGELPAHASGGQAL